MAKAFPLSKPCHTNNVQSVKKKGRCVHGAEMVSLTPTLLCLSVCVIGILVQFMMELLVGAHINVGLIF